MLVPIASQCARTVHSTDAAVHLDTHCSKKLNENETWMQIQFKHKVCTRIFLPLGIKDCNNFMDFFIVASINN
jgi:hypothetical protein